MPKPFVTLKDSFPEIAAQWDFERNGDLKPADVSFGSKQEVFWICPTCGQSYKMKICNRTAPSHQKKTAKCPVCLGRVVIPSVNSLQALFPEIVAKEWDFQRNTVSPDSIPAHTNKKYWWICEKGHSYHTKVNNKTNNNGGNSPFCSHQRLLRENSLGIVNPELAEEWDYEKNEQTPFEVAVSSNKKVWWRCQYGHSWQAKICNRNIGSRGCPICSQGRSKSFPELVIFHYVKVLFPDAISGHKVQNAEIDVFIPSQSIGVEYDGEFYHSGSKRLSNDIKKSAFLKANGIELIRIREDRCPILETTDCKVFTYKYSSNYFSLEPVLRNVLEYICEKAKIECDVEINVSAIRNEVLSTLRTLPLESSLANQHPEIAAEWDYEENYPLTPQMFRSGTEQKVSWICSTCGYRWKAAISSRANGCGCPKCAKKQRYTTAEWIQEAKTIHGDKYDYSKVNYINSKTPVVIICPKHGEFLQNPSEHLHGKGCPFCANQLFHPSESLAAKRPDIAAEWDYEKNADTGYTPETISATSTKKFYWHCNNGNPHSYLASVASRTLRNTGCAVCHGKQIDYTTSVEFLRPDLAKEWCEENAHKPSELSLGSEVKILWKCPNPLHEPYYALVYNRAHLNSGCPYCSGNKKSPAEFRAEVAQRFPNIELLSDYAKSTVRLHCRCKICGQEWQPYPHNLLKGKGCPECL